MYILLQIADCIVLLGFIQPQKNFQRQLNLKLELKEELPRI